MAVDHDDLYTAVIDLVKDAVGDSLAKVPGETATEPAVVRDSQNGIRAPHPYILVTRLLVSEPYGWTTYESIPDKDGNPTIGILKDISWNIRCVGEDALPIIEDFKDYLKSPYNRDSLRGGSEPFSVKDLSETVNLPTRIGDKQYVESAEVVLTITVLSERSEKASGYFHTVDINGELLRHEEDDDPIEVNVFATSEL